MDGTQQSYSNACRRLARLFRKDRLFQHEAGLTVLGELMDE